MKIEKIRNEQLGEEYFSIDHPTGLRIYVMPKPGYSTSYAVFGTKYGSIDTFIMNSAGETVQIPEGTAHFLEHKLFESEELDAFEQYAKTGASANAYTSFDSTCYLFSCTGDFEGSLRILLDFVQSPYFTAATVEKEQGIIGQEITMYKDVPDWEVLFNLLRALYHVHPVRIDIAGTQETISKITSDMLYDCYANFYNLNNMVLAFAGNVEVDTVLKIADELLKPAKPFNFERKPVDEPRGIVESYIEESLEVAAPIFSLGFKEEAPLPMKSIKERLTMSVLLEIIAGSTSPLYAQLMDENLINTTFGFEQFDGFCYSSEFFGGESADPKEVARRIKLEIARLRKEGVSEEDFECVRRMLYGRSVMDYNDVDDLANDLVAAHFAGESIFDQPGVYCEMTKADVDELLSRTLFEEYSALSVIVPREV